MEEQNDYLNYPQTPWYEERQNWLFIGGGVLLIVLIVGGSVWFVRSRNEARLLAVAHEELVQQTEVKLNGELTACQGADDPSSCREDEVRQSAVEALDTTFCAKLDGDARTACVTDVAVGKGDKRVCDELSDGSYCQDRVTFAIAKTNRDYDACGEIVEETLRQSCQGQLVGSALATRSCEETHLSQEVCVTLAIREEATKTGDVSLCDRLSLPESVTECVMDVNESDVDQDGLSLENERALGTDFNRADTDGDGLFDGDEKEGSDPLKADTDGDGLPDGEEVLIWGSNPRQADTDGDGFGDLEETQNGYSPFGPGPLE